MKYFISTETAEETEHRNSLDAPHVLSLIDLQTEPQKGDELKIIIKIKEDITTEKFRILEIEPPGYYAYPALHIYRVSS